MSLMVTHLTQHLQFLVQEEQVSFAHEALGSSHLEEVASSHPPQG